VQREVDGVLALVVVVVEDETTDDVLVLLLPMTLNFPMIVVVEESWPMPYQYTYLEIHPPPLQRNRPIRLSHHPLVPVPVLVLLPLRRILLLLHSSTILMHLSELSSPMPF
jgi:hypothetical protein